jgi:putative ABC transport system ATP-binding protein
MRSPEPIYRLRQVVKVRQKGGAYFELRVPEMTVQPGSFVALVGESGSGKSTLLDMLGLVLRPDAAGEFSLGTGPGPGDRVEIMDLDEPELARLRRHYIGYVLQTGGLLQFLSVRSNILLPLLINRLPAGRAEAERLARQLGIEDQLGKKPQFLSGGQRQRAAIARALAHRPPIVLADEPTAAVDRLTAIEIRDDFKDMTRSLGVTLLLVTHNQEFVADVVDRTFEFTVAKESGRRTVATVCERGET